MCWRRPQNRMRISDLEAIDISRAFSEKPHLKGKLKDVLGRMGVSLTFIGDTNKAQPYTCPLLDNDTCLVHRSAKPIECLASNEFKAIFPELLKREPRGEGLGWKTMYRHRLSSGPNHCFTHLLLAPCLLSSSDAADDPLCVALGGRPTITQQTKPKSTN